MFCCVNGMQFVNLVSKVWNTSTFSYSVRICASRVYICMLCNLRSNADVRLRRKDGAAGSS